MRLISIAVPSCRFSGGVIRVLSHGTIARDCEAVPHQEIGLASDLELLLQIVFGVRSSVARLP